MKSLEWLGNRLRFIDQTKLPAEQIYIETDDYKAVAGAIVHLGIRGAPAIGIAGAYAVVLLSYQIRNLDFKNFEERLSHGIEELKNTRPTAVNLSWALERMRNVFNENKKDTTAKIIKIMENEAITIHNEDIKMCDAIGRIGSEIIPGNAGILTHCNTGSLATGGDGTAQNVILTAYKQGKKIRVYADETRPLFQGARLTTFELMNSGIDVTLITDSTAAFVMQQNKIDLVITGADRITSYGFVANKIGTYNIASLAKMHSIPFYVAAPTSTIDLKLKEGSEIVIEERNPDEVTEYFGNRIAPPGVKVYSPAFDVTPPELISGIITEIKIAYPPFEKSLQSLFSR